MEGVPSGLYDRDGRLDPLNQRRGVANSCDFGGGVGREVQFMVDQRGGGGGGGEAEEASI